VSAILQAAGKRLKTLRKEAGKSQEQLGADSGVTAKYISQLENGRANPSLEVLHALAEQGLNIPLATFFAYDTSGEEIHGQLRQLQVLFASQSEAKRQRALRLLEAFVQ